MMTYFYPRKDGMATYKEFAQATFHPPDIRTPMLWKLPGSFDPDWFSSDSTS